VHDEALRIRLLDEAGRLLSDEGPAALSLRRLAKDVGTSTTAVYSLFGSKSALVRAVFLEAFNRFGARLDAVPRTGDPIADVIRLGIAYRESALAEPHLYAVMFGRVIPEFEPEPRDKAVAVATMNPLVAAVRRIMADGGPPGPAPETVAIGLWAQAHGLVSLELGENMPDGFDIAAHYEYMLTAGLRGWLRCEDEPADS
jgi:AcrR family transcriptional regulator